jgi:predicted dehydrogenase
MKNTCYNAALIGTGRIGFTLGFDCRREQPASHTMALLNNKHIQLIAGCDTDEESLGRWHRCVKKARAFSKSGALYESVHADVVIVAVNEDAHLAECIAAIESKPRLVILEKPVALCTVDALKIKDAAQKNNVPVMVNHERRFAKDYILAKSLLPKIGDIQTVTATLCSGMRVYSKEKESTGGYSLLHDGTHLVDIVQFLLEKDDYKNCGEPLLKNPVITGLFKDVEGDVRNLSAHYTTDVCPDVTVSISGRSKYFEFGVDIWGTEGRILIGNGFAAYEERQESKLYTGFYSLEKNDTVKFPKKTGYFANMVQNAVDYLDGTSPLRSTLNDAIADMRVLEEIKAMIK